MRAEGCTAVVLVKLVMFEGDRGRENASAAFIIPTARTPVLSAVWPPATPGTTTGAVAVEGCGVDSTDSFRTSGSAIDGRFVGLRERPMEPRFSSSSAAHIQLNDSDGAVVL